MSLEVPSPAPSWLHRLIFTQGARVADDARYARYPRRLRLLWRLVLLAALLFSFTLVLSIPLVFIPLEGFTAVLISQLVTTLAVTAAVLIARRFIDRRSFASLGLSASRIALCDVAAGFGMMAVVMGLIYLAEASLGWLEFGSAAWQALGAGQVLREIIIPTLYLVILVGWSEELLFRGYLLRNLADGLNIWWALLLSSAVFAIAHGLNPGITPIAFAGLFLAGLFMAYGALRTGQLWLPIGLHIGWNFFEGPVFGFPVSGLDIPRLLLQAETGPDLWTGGPFGPEAGLVVVPALALGALMITLYTRRRRENTVIGQEPAA